MTVAEIRKEWECCKRCPLSDERPGDTAVVGQGRQNAEFMLIYDTCSLEDSVVGNVLSTEYDTALRNIFSELDLPISDMFVTPLVACPPTAMVEATESSERTRRLRLPSATEIDLCSKRMFDLIYAVDPKLIFAAGLLTWKALVPAPNRRFTRTLAKAAGQIFDGAVPGRQGPLRYPVMPILFSDSLLKNPNPAAHGPVGLTTLHIAAAKRYLQYLKETE